MAELLQMNLITIDFCSYHESVSSALDSIGAGNILAKQSSILIKPNLINASPHPVTTPVTGKKIVAGFNPLEVDRKAAALLGFDWKKIPQIILFKKGEGDQGCVQKSTT